MKNIKITLHKMYFGQYMYLYLFKNMNLFYTLKKIYTI